MTLPSSSPSGVLRSSAGHVLVDDLESPTLSERSAHHLRRVRRIRPDEVLTLTDGAGRWRTAQVEPGEFTDLTELGEVAVEPRPSAPFELLVAIPKQDRPEWIVQRATELGVHRITFVHAERSVVRWDGDRATKHLSRLRTVAVEALEQCRRVWLPEIAGPITSAVMLAELPDVVLAEPGGAPFGDHHRRVAIGPEGGWSPGELDLARSTVSLGEHVLRVETAAVVACVLAAHTDAVHRPPGSPTGVGR